MDRSCHLVRSVIGALLLLGGCTGSEPGGSLALESRPAAPGRMELLAAGLPVASVRVSSPDLDRVSAALDPISRRILLVTQHGEDGGSSLQLIDGELSRSLLETAEALSAPVWSPAGDGFAVVRAAGPRWSGRELQYLGELWIGELDGGLRRIALDCDDAARVLGWIGDTIIFTRHGAGDLPEERLAAVAVSGHDRGVHELLAGPGHHYGFTLLGERVAVARSPTPLGSGAEARQRLQVLLVDLAGGVQVVAEEQGATPVGFVLEGETLRYQLEGQDRQVTVSLTSGLRAQAALPLAVPPPLPPGLNLSGLSMPYIHQLYDTPNSFAGNWACAPTSTVMAIQHFGRLKAWPITVNIPSPHPSDYGAYVAVKYTAHGHTFDRMQTDAAGKAAWGAYGWCTDQGAGWAWRMQDYAKKHNLSSDFSGTTTFTAVKNAINAGKVVVLSTQLTSAGHLITVKGITADGKMIVNDPWGNKTLGTYPNYKGGDAIYGFSYVTPKWHITVYGTPTPTAPSKPDYAAQPLQKDFPATMVSGSNARATLTFKNTGAATWSSNTRLGTTSPRDRESAFHSEDWISRNRAAASPGVKPDSTGSFSFTLTAPVVTEKKEYRECFNLLEEGKAWFSADGQGGPGDDAVCLSITVLPGGADDDADGVLAGEDCDDSDPAIKPGALEQCNGRDDNCDGQVDEGLSCGLPRRPVTVLPPAGEESIAIGGCAMGPARPGLSPVLLLLTLLISRRRRRR